VPIDRATDLTSAIVDWRMPPDPLHPGPFDAFYISQSPSFLPRHASFQEDEELLLTKGMTPGIYYGESLDDSRAGLRDCLSVYGSSFAVDINTARPATLEAVGLSPDEVQAVVQRRNMRPFEPRDFVEFRQALGDAGQRLILGGVSMYTLRATARLKQPDGKLSDLRRTAAALVQFNFLGNARNLPPGYQVIRWFDRT
jgi:type II secretory pathway component PulK